MADAGADELTLTIDGRVFGGWTEIDVTTGIDALAASFSLGVTERWPGQPGRWAITAGSAAIVAVGGEPVVTGHVDRAEAEIDGGDHRITVTGRSRSADLVDCAALNAPGSWTNAMLETIAAEIAAPFGITVTAETSTAPAFARFALQPGESAWEAIGRMLQQRGLIGISGVDGNVRVVSPAPGPAMLTITQGREPLRISGSHDVAERFSRYIAKGQSAGDDHASGAAVSGPRGEATDAAVARYRPLIVMAEDQATPASLEARAKWEASVRAAKAQTASVTMPGWRQPGGALWQPMQRVRLVAPAVWMDDALMVVSAAFREGERGRSTTLGLARPEAYTRMPVPADAKPSSILRGAR